METNTKPVLYSLDKISLLVFKYMKRNRDEHNVVIIDFTEVRNDLRLSSHELKRALRILQNKNIITYCSLRMVKYVYILNKDFIK